MRPCRCNRMVPGESFVRGRDCARCWHARNTPAFHSRWEVAEPLVELPIPKPHPEPLRVVRIDGSKLAGGAPRGPLDGHSNASIARWNGRLVMAYRHRWAGAEVWMTTLDDDTFQPSGPGARLDLRHRRAPYGREDPRLFVHRGRLHVAYAGVEGMKGPTTQLYARLSEDGMRVEEAFEPRYNRRKPWEKNHQPFSHDGELFWVYTISPHAILRCHGNRADKAYETPGPKWSGGPLRGGAAPVRVGDEYVSFFHGAKYFAGRKTYTCGVYRFKASPPFEVTGITPSPIMYGDGRTRPADWPICNFFPCGAILEDQRWLVSAGAHDRWIEIVEWDARDVCRAMQPVVVGSKCRAC